MSKIVQWRLKPMRLNSNEFSLMTKEELQKEGREYIKKLQDDGEIVEEIIESNDYLTIKLKD